MNNNTPYTNGKTISYEQKMELVEQGRRLHNQAIQQLFIMTAGMLTRFSGFASGSSSKNREFGYFFKNMPVKK